jgi:hypothetical protein
VVFCKNTLIRNNQCMVLLGNLKGIFTALLNVSMTQCKSRQLITDTIQVANLFRTIETIHLITAQYLFALLLIELNVL